MTAEVALINASAITLAADSAVTIGGKRTYAHANKIFELSKNQPIGIMIYGTAEFGKIQFETLIKDFRRTVANGTEFKNLLDCQKEFVKFLNRTKHKSFLLGYGRKSFDNFPILLRALESLTTPDFFFDTSSNLSRKNVINALDNDLQNLKQQNIEALSAKVVLLKNFMKSLKINNAEKDIQNAIWANVANNYGNTRSHPILNRLEEIEKFLGMKTVIEKIAEIYLYLISRKKKSISSTGYFLCGFGSEDYFPSFYHGILDGTNNKNIRHWEIEASDGKQPQTRLIPLAQQDLTEAFIFGVEEKWINTLTDATSTIIEEMFKALDPKNTVPAGTKDNIYSDLNAIWQERVSRLKSIYYKPVDERLTKLPKEEMALLADALVELTSVRRKFDSQLQTVGGPIDVAIITRGDGFIWSKRKHYFSAEMNPSWHNKQELE